MMKMEESTMMMEITSRKKIMNMNMIAIRILSLILTVSAIVSSVIIRRTAMTRTRKPEQLIQMIDMRY